MPFRQTLLLLSVSLVFVACMELPRPKEYAVFFDDFNYESIDDPLLESFGWIIREGTGGPGNRGVRWQRENASIIDVPGEIDNKAFRLTARTNGTGRTTSQSELRTSPIFLEGTYAARIYFSDSPTEGPDGDQLTQTFFAISPFTFDLDPDYSETDFAEYLPNGGWGEEGPHFWVTSWETYQASPWIQDAKSDFISGSFAGWHFVSATIDKGKIHYFIDGQAIASHGGIYFPETPMRISFNLWFLAGGLESTSESRTYEQLIDWVYFSEDTQMEHSSFTEIIASERSQNIDRRNSL
ncbi:glycoside hydrolase family 16 protein [Jiulongibacter sp. NS-SX5]|uniref:glycoside hydrolase family 16 protein n=1 Tax=Jiulongibacter sp. NS-SX5 TaxID=3463854 RepID=UPI00405990BC